MLATGAGLRCLRDPTRGGLAATLNEIATQSGVGMVLREQAIPVKPVVAAACEFLCTALFRPRQFHDRKGNL